MNINKFIIQVGKYKDMRKTMLVICILHLLFAFPCCSENKTIEGELPPPIESKEGIYGSFENKYKRYAEKEKHEGQNLSSKIITQWSDTVWQNERVHSQIVLWAEKDVENITFHVSDLKSGSQIIPSSKIKLRYPTYVLGDVQALECEGQSTRQSAYIADALSEVTINRIQSSDPAKVWITIDIPKETVPGLYKGTIDVKQGTETKLSFEIELLVTKYSLPDVNDWAYHLDIWQFPFQMTNLCNRNGIQIKPFSLEYESLMSSFYKMLADAGQKAITTYIKDGAFQAGETMVDWRLNHDNTWSFDYTNFDKFVELMFSLGIDKQINCFSLVGWKSSIGYYDAANSSYKNKELKIGTDEYNEIWTIFLNSFRTHLKSKGWFDKAVLYLDEARDDDMRKVVNLIKQNGEDWKIGLAGSRIAADIESELYDYSTILGYDKASTNTISTFYTSCSQTIPNNYVSKQTSPAEMVWMSWYAASQGYNGYLRWAFDYWTNLNPLNIQDGTNTAGDFNMIYRTDNSLESKAMASIRFELLREGIQDYEKIRILNSDQLNSFLQKFDDASAVNAEELITEGQAEIKRISALK